IEEELAEVEQVETVQADIGGGMVGAGEEQASFTVITGASADLSEVETHIQTTLDAYFLDNPEVGEFQIEARGGMMGLDTDAIQLDALDEADLSEAAEKLPSTCEDLDDVAGVHSDFQAAARSLEIVPPEDEIADYGMTVPAAMGLIAWHTSDFPV